MDEDNQQEEQKDEVPISSGDPEIEKLQTDLAQAKDSWMRAMADFENYKRRKENENKELVEFAREVTVAKLLPALDSLEQALKHMPVFSVVAPLMEPITPEQPTSNQAEPDKSGNYTTEDFAKAYENWQKGA